MTLYKVINGEIKALTKEEETDIIAMYNHYELQEKNKYPTELKNSLQKHIDSKAQDKNYKDGFACASYANSTNATWKNEALAFIAWRDNCWQYAIDVQNDVEDGVIEPPSVEDFIANAPVLTWT